jgi:hypothetical protein
MSEERTEMDYFPLIVRKFPEYMVVDLTPMDAKGAIAQMEKHRKDKMCIMYMKKTTNNILMFEYFDKQFKRHSTKEVKTRFSLSQTEALMFNADKCVSFPIENNQDEKVIVERIRKNVLYNNECIICGDQEESHISCNSCDAATCMHCTIDLHKVQQLSCHVYVLNNTHTDF